MPDSITVRRPNFTFPDDMELVFIPDDPQNSFYFLAAWMTLPYLEPYLVRTIKAAAEQVTDPALAEEMRLFCTQEGVHYKEHAKANRVIRRAHPQFARLAELEQQLKAEYARFTETKSLRWNLAYAEAFEAITTASARSQFEMRFFEPMAAPLGELFAWHIMEELEHRTVAFEALEAVAPGYWYRVTVGTRCLMHYMRWTFRMYKAMAEAAPEVLGQPIEKAAKKRRDKIRSEFLRRTFPRWLRIYLPSYHPRKLDLPANFYEVQARYDQFADAA